MSAHSQKVMENILHAFSSHEQAYVDIRHYRELQRRKQRREKILVVAGLIAAVFVTFFIYGIVIFRLM